MKDKILMTIIGILIGSIITTICFFIYFKMNNVKRMENIPNMNNGQMMEILNGEMRRPDENMNPPVKPEGM